MFYESKEEKAVKSGTERWVTFRCTKSPKGLLYVKGKVKYKNGKCKTYSEDSGKTVELR